MRWRIIVCVMGLLAFSVRGAEETSVQWDKGREEQIRTLMQQGDAAQAEKVAIELLAEDPDSSQALLYHVWTLSSLGRHEEALTESLVAARMKDANEYLAHEWIGACLILLGRYTEAGPELDKAYNLNPNDYTVEIWRAEAQRKQGQSAKADAMLDTLLAKWPPANRSAVMNQIASIDYELKEGANAVKWWRRSAELGDREGKRGLAGAYSNGVGVSPDEGEASYWQRQAGDILPWFPRWPDASAWIARTHGWILVLILMAVALVVPAATVGLGAHVLGRKLTADPAIHWTERARQAYPFTIYITVCTMLLPVIYATQALSYPRSQLPLPRWLLVTGIGCLVLYLLCRLAAHWEKRYRAAPAAPWQIARNLFVVVVLVGPVVVVFCQTNISLWGESGWRAVGIAALGVLAFLILQFGGWQWFVRILRLATPGDAALVAMGEQQARARRRAAPRLWILRWDKANALAFIYSNTIMFTARARKILNDEETYAVLAHEMGHLCEPWTIKALRLMAPLIFFPLFLLPAPWNASNPTLIVAAYFAGLVVFIALQKVRRRMEVRADTFGLEAQQSEGAYARALAHLYEDNLTPAVMPGKRKVHPHLYDRLLTAGVTPDFPRPKPPGRWGLLPAIAVIALNLGLLSAIWLLLF